MPGTPLKGMHNSSAGREATQGLSSWARKEERVGEGKKGKGKGKELEKEGEQVGLGRRGEQGPGTIFPAQC